MNFKSRIRQFKIFLLDLPSLSKILLSLTVDFTLCFITAWIAFILRIGQIIPINIYIIQAALISILIAIPVFLYSGLYRTIFRYTGWPAMLAVARSNFIYGFIYVILITFISFEGIPRTLGFIQPILLFLFIGASRSFIAFWLGNLYKKRLKSIHLPRALIYGAGKIGRELVMASKNSRNLDIVGFIDDDPRKWSRLLCNKPIFSFNQFQNIVKEKNISYLLLAIPTASREKRDLIIKEAIKNHLAVRTSPDFGDIADGKIPSMTLVDLGAEDLLGRKKVIPDKELMQKNIRNKVVLVSGAGGTIGSQLCKEIIKNNPKKLLLLDSNEYSLYSILDQLDSLNNDREFEIIPLLASIQDESKINIIFKTYFPDTVYHAAAYKHVPIVEHNLSEGVKNNVFGTLCIAKASQNIGVSDFVFISTDKAVRPTNVMGATKRLGEICLQALFAWEKNDKKTKFSMVRFGNVLDSSGSVIPRFRQQIKDRTPITLTHPDITRFFMTIDEAAELVIQAGAMSDGGDVFVLDMGEPVKIYDLAVKMIQLSGLKLRDKSNPNGDIEIVVTGLRPGEKLYEELLIGNNPLPTIHPKIFRAQDEFLDWDKLNTEIQKLEKLISNNDLEEIVILLKKLVLGYSPAENIVDWIFNEKLKKNY